MAGADNDAQDLEMVPSARRVLIALGVVMALSIAMIGGALVVAERTTVRANALTTNSLRSEHLISELRHQVDRLEHAPPAEWPTIEGRITAELAAYRPVATAPGEATEWWRFRRLLDQFLAAPDYAPDRAVQVEQMEASLQRMAESNARAAQRRVARIESAQRDGFIAQVIAGLITLICVGVVAAVVTGIMRRQRRLIRRNLASLHDRNRELAEFARRTAHDLRQPLSPIRGYAELLADGAAIDVKYAASKIRSASNKMAEIIENLLALSVTGHLPAGTANVPQLVRTILDDMRDELANADVRTELEDCTAACAPSVLGQLLHNVLMNASKYREPERPLQVHVVARSHGSEIELSVSDNGIGMAPNVVAHAFDPAYRASEVGRIAGHGLGLSIVKRTIDAIGGSCTLKSQPDRGSEIVMRLPAAEAAKEGAT